MQSFLQLVAHDLYTKIGNDLSRTVLVFPNKRANLFFNEYLAGESDKPIWSPAAMSISDLFQKLSVQKSGDPIRLVCELYKVFKEETRSQETLDDFYFWGELLISDFDDVDKNMVDADKLFSNLQDLKNLMDDYEFLDKEQEEAIQQFFQNFSIEKRTELKEKFIEKFNMIPEENLFNGRNLSMELCIESDLKTIGLKDENIYSLKLCTHCEKESKLFSYRASNGTYGRLFSFIYIK